MSSKSKNEKADDSLKIQRPFGFDITQQLRNDRNKKKGLETE